MKKRNITKSIFVISLIVIILVAGCGKSENTKQVKEETKVEEETTEGQTEESQTEEDSEGEDTNGDSSKKSEGQAISYIEYKDEYSEIPFDEMEDVSENGNPYDFDTSLLGYYTNGYIGFNFYQVDGDFIKTDFFLYDYYIGYGTVDIMSPTTISFVYTAGTYGSVDTDGVFATTDTADTNIDLSSGSFELTTTGQLGEWLNMSMMQDTASLLASIGTVDQGTKLYWFSLGVYDKMDDSYISENLRTIDSYSLWDGSGYYQNNQPKKDRMSMEQYPLYVETVPEEGYYIWTESGNNPVDGGEDFILAKVETTNQEEIGSDGKSIGITLCTYRWFNNGWISSCWSDPEGGGLFTYTIGRFMNFNYEVPEYEFTGYGDIANKVDDTKHLVDYRITMTVNDDGTLSFDTLRKNEIYYLDGGNTPSEEITIDPEGKFKLVDKSVLDVLTMNQDYRIP